MIPEIKKILYTTDLSPNARYAFGYAASMAEKYNAKITILNVLEYISDSMNSRLKSMMGEERWEEIQDRNEKEALSEIGHGVVWGSAEGRDFQAVWVRSASCRGACMQVGRWPRGAVVPGLCPGCILDRWSVARARASGTEPQCLPATTKSR